MTKKISIDNVILEVIPPGVPITPTDLYTRIQAHMNSIGKTTANFSDMWYAIWHLIDTQEITLTDDYNILLPSDNIFAGSPMGQIWLVCSRDYDCTDIHGSYQSEKDALAEVERIGHKNCYVECVPIFSPGQPTHAWVHGTNGNGRNRPRLNVTPYEEPDDYIDGEYYSTRSYRTAIDAMAAARRLSADAWSPELESKFKSFFLPSLSNHHHQTPA